MSNSDRAGVDYWLDVIAENGLAYAQDTLEKRRELEEVGPTYRRMTQDLAEAIEQVRNPKAMVEGRLDVGKRSDPSKDAQVIVDAINRMADLLAVQAEGLTRLEGHLQRATQILADHNRRNMSPTRGW